MAGPDPTTAELLRDVAPRVLGVVARDQDFADAEDAVQEAMLAAHRQWPADGVPDNPTGWLVRVARRRLVDLTRAEVARHDREERWETGRTASAEVPDADDTLELLVLCCHRDLTPASAIALTLRAVGGLTTAEVARALLAEESAVAQRISRAKRRIRDAGSRLERPSAPELPGRLAQVLQVLYLVFNEGYLASGGDDLQRPDLAAEAIRITRLLRRSLPHEPEVTGLLALMLLTDARRDARQTAAGDLVPLPEQDRSRWDADRIREGLRLAVAALAHGPAGPYGVQAAIQAVHAEAASAEQTDWPQILALYDVLRGLQPGPVLDLNRAVAVAMVHGPEAGLHEVDAAAAALEEAGAGHRVAATRAHLLRMRGDADAAARAFAEAAALALTRPEREHLAGLAARIGDRSEDGEA